MQYCCKSNTGILFVCLWGYSSGKLKRKAFTWCNEVQSQLWCFQTSKERKGRNCCGRTTRLWTLQQPGCEHTESICHFTWAHLPCWVPTHVYSNVVWWKRTANSPCAELQEKQFLHLEGMQVGTSSKLILRKETIQNLRSQGCVWKVLISDYSSSLQLLSNNQKPIKNMKSLRCLVHSAGCIALPSNLTTDNPQCSLQTPKLHYSHSRFRQNV